MIEDFLLQVNKPARYIGNEWNVSKKEFNKAGIKFALCFPDLYEIGMSNLGLRIIYGILNNIDDVVCERVFSCPQDLENIFRRNNIAIFSLESRRPLRDFDMLGFSLGYELSYTNALNILELGGIPLKSAQRGNKDPLVIAGGPCALNPEPMHEFFDLFVIGEAEEAILEIVDSYRKLKNRFRSGEICRQELLAAFLQIEGVYAPSLYEVYYEADGGLKKIKPKTEDAPLRIKKRIVRDFNNAYFPYNWIIPYVQIIHDRVTLEIMRGCPNACRFCQARSQYYPFRVREPERAADIAYQAYKRTGYEEISLCGLSVSDYQNIDALLKRLLDLFREDSISLSLPSIKPKAIVASLSSLIAAVKKTGLTFAPEAATERLRKIIGKDFDTESFFRVVEQSFLSGYRHIKLYFMIGLPFEEERDLDAILGFAEQVFDLGRRVNPALARKGWVNISINTLIPKPHTPLQWLNMENIGSVKRKQHYLLRNVKNKRLKLTFHNPYMGFLEAALSRGDRRVSSVILDVFNKGARFDAWEEHFDFSKWMAAFDECGINPEFYLQKKSIGDNLAWDFLDIGISKEILVKEFNNVIAGK